MNESLALLFMLVMVVGLSSKSADKKPRNADIIKNRHDTCFTIKSEQHKSP